MPAKKTPTNKGKVARKRPAARPAHADLGPPPDPTAPPVSPPKKKVGRPPHQPTDQQRDVVRLAMFAGMTHDQAARLLRIDPGTLATHYREELDFGADRLAATVAGNLLSLATQRQDRRAQLTALIFLAKTRLGWRDGSGLAAEAEAKFRPAPGQGEDGVVRVTLKIGERGDTD